MIRVLPALDWGGKNSEDVVSLDIVCPGDIIVCGE